MILGAVAVFLAIYMLPNVDSSLRVIATGMVGLVGVLSFIGHVIFHRSDAERLGSKRKTPTGSSRSDSLTWHLGWRRSSPWQVTGISKLLL